MCLSYCIIINELPSNRKTTPTKPHSFPIGKPTTNKSTTNVDEIRTYILKMKTFAVLNITLMHDYPQKTPGL